VTGGPVTQLLTLKTVEFHLRQIYRELGVRSRSQLVATLAQDPALLTGRPAVAASSLASRTRRPPHGPAG
jgi:hypothetical protein